MPLAERARRDCPRMHLQATPRGLRHRPRRLTRRQFSSAIVAMQEYIKLLHKEAAKDPQGGEHEDILIAESELREMIRVNSTPKQSG